MPGPGWRRQPRPVTIQFTGTGIQLSLVVQPTVLDFGNTLINTTTKKSVTLTNKSTAAVTGITAPVTGGDANLFAVDNAPTTLGPGDSATVDISYSPLALQTRSLADVNFVGSDGEKAKLNLFGEPVGVALTVAPNPINFGYVPLTTTAIGCTTGSKQANVSGRHQRRAMAPSTTRAARSGRRRRMTPRPGTRSQPSRSRSPAAAAPRCASPSRRRSRRGLQRPGHALETTDPSGSNPIVGELTGWGGGPQLTCAPLSIDFGQTLDHSITTVPVICTNTGTAIPSTNLTD